jgi:hypothetical protein
MDFEGALRCCRLDVREDGLVHDQHVRIDH